ncbi:MAG: ATP-binding protein [Acidobacteria bacterium]|nr:ATP-binding protein [Acidobacteriota bacterium]
MRFFNVAGPCRPGLHYMLPASERLRADNIMRLIEQQNYFVLHAPRQVGKTTAVIELARELTATGKWTAAKVSMEVGRGLGSDLDRAERTMLADWRGSLEHQLPAELRPPPWPTAEAGQRIGAALQAWSSHSSRPLVVFLDEIDALEDDVLLSVLRQLRSGYDRRPSGFPASLAVVGLRDILDYKVMSGGSARLGTPSPFNIAARSLTLRNFTESEVATLLQQHTAESVQVFEPAALQHVFTLTQGQPWLVNALAKTAVEDVEPDVQKNITVEHIEQAKELVIARRHLQLKQLTHKLTTGDFQSLSAKSP